MIFEEYYPGPDEKHPADILQDSLKLFSTTINEAGKALTASFKPVVDALARLQIAPDSARSLTVHGGTCRLPDGSSSPQRKVDNDGI